MKNTYYLLSREQSLELCFHLPAYLVGKAIAELGKRLPVDLAPDLAVVDPEVAVLPHVEEADLDRVIDLYVDRVRADRHLAGSQERAQATGV